MRLGGRLPIRGRPTVILDQAYAGYPTDPGPYVCSGERHGGMIGDAEARLEPFFTTKPTGRGTASVATCTASPKERRAHHSTASRDAARLSRCTCHEPMSRVVPPKPDKRPLVGNGRSLVEDETSSAVGATCAGKITDTRSHASRTRGRRLSSRRHVRRRSTLS